MESSSFTKTTWPSTENSAQASIGADVRDHSNSAHERSSPPSGRLASRPPSAASCRTDSLFLASIALSAERPAGISPEVEKASVPQQTLTESNTGAAASHLLQKLVSPSDTDTSVSDSDLEMSIENEIGGYEDEDEGDHSNSLGNSNRFKNTDTRSSSSSNSRSAIAENVLSDCGSADDDNEIDSDDGNRRDVDFEQSEGVSVTGGRSNSRLSQEDVAPGMRRRKAHSHSPKEFDLAAELNLPKPSNLIEEVWMSIFTPGVNQNVVFVIDVCFYALFMSWFGLAIVTGGNFHAIFLLVISICLFASVKWFIAESKKLQNTNGDDANMVEDAGDTQK